MRSINLIILLGLCYVAGAQTMGKQTLAQLEESPAGTKILWFMDAVNEGADVSDDKVNALFAKKLIEKLGMDDLKNSIKDIQDNEGRLMVYVAKREKTTKYKLKVKGEKSGEWFDMVFYFQDVQPYKMLGYSIDSVPGGNDSNKPVYPIKN